MILNDMLNILKTSNNIAYTIDGQSYSYNQLYKFVCNLYYYLLENNKNKKPVIVYGHKEIYMKASFLACSFAGMTYIPVDISTPKERFEQIKKQVNPKIIIGKDILEEEIYKIMNKSSFNDISEIFLKPNDIYYIIFTSGSTGIPKGVKITYKNLDSCLNWLKNITKIKNGTILNQSNFSFDLSVADLYLSILSNSEHFIINNHSNLDFNKTFEQLKYSNANLAVITPSYADLLLLDKSFGKELMPNLETILFCGEKLLKSTVKKLNERFENLKIINCYGPTECTFAVTSIEINSKMINSNEIPIGYPKDGVSIYILDENMEILQDNKVGEIMITGNSVGNGYITESENNSFFDYKGRKAYLTGDLGYIKNNILYYVGRKDNQIKFKGYRIELSDIESNLQKLPYVEKSVAIAKKNIENTVQNIVAFVMLKENENKSEFQIRKDILNMLPLYMCPKIKIVKKFPINNNGKCDYKKLMEEL